MKKPKPRKIYSLNAGDKTPKCIAKNHHWIIISKPDNFRSGEHHEICEKCGIEKYYDTSD